MPHKSDQVRLSRAPQGTGKARRVNLSLLPDEHAELQRRAEADGRTLSGMARLLVLRAFATNQESAT